MRVDVEKSISGCQYNNFVEEVGTKLVYLILKRKFETFIIGSSANETMQSTCDEASQGRSHSSWCSTTSRREILGG